METLPKLSITLTPSILSKTSCPKAPAFIFTAPPTLPGIPEVFSRPPNPSLTVKATKSSHETPAPTQAESIGAPPSASGYRMEITKNLRKLPAGRCPGQGIHGYFRRDARRGCTPGDVLRSVQSPYPSRGLGFRTRSASSWSNCSGSQ